jgi:hypothetical protein
VLAEISGQTSHQEELWAAESGNKYQSELNYLPQVNLILFVVLCERMPSRPVFQSFLLELNSLRRNHRISSSGGGGSSSSSSSKNSEGFQDGP